MNLYSLFLTIGVLAGILNAFYLTKKLNLDYQNLLEKIVIVFISGLFGARLTYIILYPNQFEKFIDYLAIWEGGLVSFGGIIFGLITVYVLFKGKNQDIWSDIMANSFFLGWVFGRIGGFLTHNTYGYESEFFGQFFYGRIPTTLFESLLALIIWVFGQKVFPLKRLWPSLIFYRSLIYYSFGRLMIDIFRDEPEIVLNLKLSQLTSLLIILCVIMAIEFKRKDLNIPND